MKFPFNYLYDKIFWICFIFYFDPGGIQTKYFQNDIFSRVNFSDLLFVIMISMFLMVQYKPDMDSDSQLPSIKKLLVFYLIWISYYVVVFGLITFQGNKFDLLDFIRRSRNIFMIILLIYPIYTFTVRSIEKFYKYLMLISIVFLIGFFITIWTNFKIMPILEYKRYYIDENRKIFYGYGDMLLLINLFMVHLIFKIKQNHKILVSICGILMILANALSITRRLYVSFIFYFIIYIYLYKKYNYKPIVNSRSLKILVMIIVGIIAINLIVPKIIQISVKTFENIYNTYVLKEKEANKRKDLRLTLKHPFFISLFKKNMYFGTGYDKNWLTGERLSLNKNYQTSDYPLLSTLAAFGIVGLLVFSGYYFWLFKFLYYLYKRYMYNYIKYIDEFPVENLLLISLLGYFIYLSTQYINYFMPICLRKNAGQIIFYTAMMAGLVKRIEIKISQIEVTKEK
jgi:hypothetical protein